MTAAEQKPRDPKTLTIEDCWAIYNRAPKFFKALDLEDISEIRK